MEKSKIHHYIAELLYEHDCVIVPALGGFVARYHSASLSAQSVYSPPSKSILFNRNLNNNDGLLANKIMSEEGLNFEESNRLINDFVSESLATLYNNKRLELYPLGFFYYSSENILQFEASTDVNYLIDAYGLPDILVRPIIRKKEEKELKFVDRTANDLLTKRKKYRRVAAMAIGIPALATLMFLTGKNSADKDFSFADFNFFKSKTKSVYVTKATNSNFKINIPASTSIEADSSGIICYKISETENKNIYINTFDTIAKVFENAEIPIETKLNSTNSNSRSTTVSLLTTASASGTYQVVVGCFANENNAYKLVSKLKSENYPASILGKNKNGLFVVSAGGYNNLNEAKNTSINVRVQFPGAWILDKNSI